MSEGTPPSSGRIWFARLSVLLLTVLATFSLHLRLTGKLSSPELFASLGLLAFNYLLFLNMLMRKAPVWLGGFLGFGLFLVTVKLFVNTFTILLLIGLQAVRTPVFVPVFFVGYFVLLGTTIWTLQRTTSQD